MRNLRRADETRIDHGQGRLGWVSARFLLGCLSLLALPGLAGCEGGVAEGAADAGDSPPPVEVRETALHTGCAPNQSLCSCVLRGTPACEDPDGDGVLTLYDNCRGVWNANQANCDGDGSGDACDSDNVIVTTRQESATTPAIDTGRTTCIYDEDVRGIFFGEITWQTGTRTIETRRHCGPSGQGISTAVIDTDISTHTCWNILFYGCDFTQPGPNPQPICGS
jgi:hypothetical protein